MSNEAKPQAPTILSESTISAFTDEDLLDLYVSLPKKLRDDYFISTAIAAGIAGVTQRTIQLWIEIGLIRAVLIGRKYRVFAPSLKDHLKNQAIKRPR